MNTPSDSHYVAHLADQLAQRHAALLATAENDLAIVTTFIHNPEYDDTARRTLAHELGLPEPTQTQP